MGLHQLLERLYYLLLASFFWKIIRHHYYFLHTFHNLSFEHLA